MPAIGTHVLILEKTIEKLMSTGEEKYIEIAQLIEKNKNLAQLGSIEPDLFYYSDQRA